MANEWESAIQKLEEFCQLVVEKRVKIDDLVMRLRELLACIQQAAFVEKDSEGTILHFLVLQMAAVVVVSDSMSKESETVWQSYEKDLINYCRTLIDNLQEFKQIVQESDKEVKLHAWIEKQAQNYDQNIKTMM
ncbi:MAG: hypothetical protein V1838_02025 [Patescibacteria group bacterium]